MELWQLYEFFFLKCSDYFFKKFLIWKEVDDVQGEDMKWEQGRSLNLMSWLCVGFALVVPEVLSYDLLPIICYCP